MLVKALQDMRDENVPIIVAVPNQWLRLAILDMIYAKWHDCICVGSLVELEEQARKYPATILVVDIFAFSLTMEEFCKWAEEFGTCLTILPLVSEKIFAHIEPGKIDDRVYFIPKERSVTMFPVALDAALCRSKRQSEAYIFQQKQSVALKEKEGKDMENGEKNLLKKNIGRRSFLKGSAAAAVVTGVALHNAPGDIVLNALAVADEKQASAALEEVITPGVCRGGCGSNCQMNVHVRGGKIVKTSRINYADPNMTRLCNKGLTHALRVYAPERVKYPMKRVGERGGGQWEQISWDEAITTITDTWKKNIAEHGPTSVSFIKGSGNISADAHYGQRLFSAMGSVRLDPAQDRALYVAGPAAVGYSQYFCGSGLEDAWKSKNIFLWGYNPTESVSQIAHYIIRAQTEHGAKLISIDPSYNIMASKSDMYVAIHPGTDGALAMAMGNILVQEGLIDEEYLGRMTVAPFLAKDSDGKYLRLSDLGRATAGTPEDAIVVRSAEGVVGIPADIPNPVITGKYVINGIQVTTTYDLLCERYAEWPAERASQICDIPVEKIHELAMLVADGPSAVMPGLGLDHVTNGVATYAAIFSLMMITGQIGKPGGGLKGPFGAEASIGHNFRVHTSVPGLPPCPTFYSPGLFNVLDTGKYGKYDINLKSLYIWGHNIFGTQVGAVTWRKLIDKMDLYVVADVVLSGAARYADIVLPVCHYFETDSYSGEQTRNICYNAKSAEPLYESKSDYDIMTLLFEKMGLSEYHIYPKDKYFEMCFDNPTSKALGITWDRLKKEGNIMTMFNPDYIHGADGKFTTPTGRLQFYQEVLPLDTDYGQKIDFMKERLPYWEEPMEAWRENPIAQKYPLNFTSERCKFKVHTQYTYIPWLLELEPEPYVTANPQTCKERGIEDGDYIRMFNDRASCVLKVRYNDGCRPGMVTIDHGWEDDQFVEGFYCDLIGSNVTPVVANSYYFDVLVEIEKANIK